MNGKVKTNLELKSLIAQLSKSNEGFIAKTVIAFSKKIGLVASTKFSDNRQGVLADINGNEYISRSIIT